MWVLCSQNPDMKKPKFLHGGFLINQKINAAIVFCTENTILYSKFSHFDFLWSPYCMTIDLTSFQTRYLFESNGLWSQLCWFLQRSNSRSSWPTFPSPKISFGADFEPEQLCPWYSQSRTFPHWSPESKLSLQILDFGLHLRIKICIEGWMFTCLISAARWHYRQCQLCQARSNFDQNCLKLKSYFENWPCPAKDRTQALFSIFP